MNELNKKEYKKMAKICKTFMKGKVPKSIIKNIQNNPPSITLEVKIMETKESDFSELTMNEKQSIKDFINQQKNNNPKT